MKIHLLVFALSVTTMAFAAPSARDKVIDYEALYYAAQGENVLLVEALLERGAPVDAPGVDSAGQLSFQAVNFNSPLQAAAERGNVRVVRLLLKHSPWIDHRCCDGPAALGLAADAGHAEVVEILLKAGADPTVKSVYDEKFLEIPLDAARRKGHAEVVRLLEAAMKTKH